MTKSLSFCSTCRNRLWQLKETLLLNLNIIQDEHEIVLIDYGSSDGLSNWVWDNCQNYIEAKKLIFFEVKNEVRWNVSRAKNLAHRLAHGEYLFNLDADNFLTNKDIELIDKCRDQELISWQFTGDLMDGSFGRIGMPRRHFNEIGGYDETFLPMAGQDRDILKRLSLTHKVVKLPPPSRSAIINSSRDKIKELIQADADENHIKDIYPTMNLLNFNTSKFKLETEGAARVGGGFSYRGFLNGKSVTINGFNDINYNS